MAGFCDVHCFDCSCVLFMVLGSTTEASLSSSAIWAPVSGPMKYHNSVERPMRAEIPNERQPPPS